MCGAVTMISTQAQELIKERCGPIYIPLMLLPRSPNPCFRKSLKDISTKGSLNVLIKGGPASTP